jgi:Zn-dependent peptidase ImmA (M78 family)
LTIGGIYMKLSSALFQKEANHSDRGQRKPHRWTSPAALSLCRVVGTDDPEKAVRRVASELVEESGLQRPARNLPLLASFRYIDEIEECEMPGAGRLIPTSEGLKIQVNKNHTEGRRNFSVCHEITHTLIPNYRDGIQNRADDTTGFYGIDKEEEYLCDVGASELLMPTHEFLSVVGETGTSLEVLPVLASEFGASLEAAAIKLIRTTGNDIAVIVWEMGWKPSQVRQMQQPSLFDPSEVPPPPQQLRVKYAATGGSLAAHYFPKDKSVGQDTLIYEAYAAEKLVCGPQELMTGDGAIVAFTESLAVPYWRDGILETKVLTLVTPL